MERNNKELSKAITIGALLKIDIGNPNAGWSEGIVTVLKKVERPDGKVHPYISGQALRRYLRDTLGELLSVLPEEESSGEKLSPLQPSNDPKAPIITEGNPQEYIDDDLFGFMRAVRGKTKRRESPLRVSPAFGLFPYAGDRDLGTKSALEVRETAEAGGAMFETEITNNIFRTTLLLELDRVGKWKKWEIASETEEESEEEREGEIPQNKRKNRVILLLKALKYLWGGGRRSRFLMDLTPQFIIYARMSKKIPLFLNAINVYFEDGRYVLDEEMLKEVIRDYESDIQKLIVGVRRGFFGNSDLSALKTIKINNAELQILSVGKAIDDMQEDVKVANF